MYKMTKVTIPLSGQPIQVYLFDAVTDEGDKGSRETDRQHRLSSDDYIFIQRNRQCKTRK